MKRWALVLASLLGVSVTGCASQSKMDTQLGQFVTLVGTAEARKLGAALRGDDFEVWIDQLQDWPSNYVGQKVRVTGVLEERQDLPVYVQRPGEPAAAGIPVPEGADLREASRRYVLRDAKWSLIR